MAAIPQSPTTPPPLITPDDESPKTLFDDPDADIILRSRDSQEFRVLKLYIIKSSPVLGKQIEATPQLANSTDAETPLPIVQLSDNAAVLSTLLTFIFPVLPAIPSTLEETMELLSVAQKYEMVSVLAHIRGCVALRDYPLICSENAFHAYFLAQNYGLRQEAVLAARITLTFTLAIEKLRSKPDVMPGAYLYELWKYHRSAQANLTSNIEEFIKTCAASTMSGLKCVSLSPEGIPCWLDEYIWDVFDVPYPWIVLDHPQRELEKRMRIVRTYP